MSPLHFLNQRRSVPAPKLAAPGPDRQQLEQILGAAMRVPDHGRLEPFRILAIEGPQRDTLGAFLAQRALELDPQTPPAQLDKDRKRFSHAPLVLAVIACPQPNPKVPEIEQLMTTGCVCFALLQAAQALGFGAQWLTGWAARDAAVKARLGIAEDESIAGFIHIGQASNVVAERSRPELSSHFSRWPG